jgi:hypothetical protein
MAIAMMMTITPTARYVKRFALVARFETLGVDVGAAVGAVPAKRCVSADDGQ